MRVIDVFTEPVHAVAASPDGQFLAACAGFLTRVIDWRSGEANVPFGFSFPINQAAFTAAGDWLAIAYSNGLYRLNTVGAPSPVRCRLGILLGRNRDRAGWTLARRDVHGPTTTLPTAAVGTARVAVRHRLRFLVAVRSPRLQSQRRIPGWNQQRYVRVANCHHRRSERTTAHPLPRRWLLCVRARQPDGGVRVGDGVSGDGNARGRCDQPCHLAW